MKRSLLVVVGLVVLAGGIGLVLWMRKGEDAAASAPPRDRGAAGTTAPPVGSDNGSTHVTATPRPALDEHPAGGSAATTEYVSGDVRVRDHRTGDQAPMDLPPNLHPPDGRKIHSNLTAEIAQKVKAGMYECARSIPPEARGLTPRLEGQIVIAIKNKQVTITSAATQLRDVVGASVEPAKKCIEDKALLVTQPAGDEADLENYSINLSFAIP